MAKLVGIYSSGTGVPVGCLPVGCLWSSLKVPGVIVLSVSILLGSWAVLEDPQRGIAPESPLMSALCGNVDEGVTCEPGPVAVEGFDLRIPFSGETNTLGWGVFGLFLLWPFLTRNPFAAGLKRTLIFWGLRLAIAGAYLFFPSGLMVQQLVKGFFNRILELIRLGVHDARVVRWDQEITAEIEAITPPDSFFEPQELEDPRAVLMDDQSNLSVEASEGRPKYSREQARKAVMNLMARAQKELKAQLQEGDMQLLERISLLETSPLLGDIRMILIPKPEGNVVVFLGEDPATVEILNQVEKEIYAGVEALPIIIADIQISDELLDGSKIAEEEKPD